MQFFKTKVSLKFLWFITSFILWYNCIQKMHQVNKRFYNQVNCIWVIVWLYFASFIYQYILHLIESIIKFYFVKHSMLIKEESNYRSAYVVKLHWLPCTSTSTSHIILLFFLFLNIMLGKFFYLLFCLFKYPLKEIADYLLLNIKPWKNQGKLNYEHENVAVIYK